MPQARLLLAAALAAAALVVVLALPSAARPADVGSLVGTVGPGFSISLADASGNRVTHLDPGDYTILVHDLADIHDFHLSGPGVDMTTGVEETGDVTWHVTLTDGTYTFVCDPHSTQMAGSFTVGSAQAPAPAPAPAPVGKPAPKPVVAPAKLVGTVGPGFSIALRSASGASVRVLRAGAYVLTIRDLATIHNFVLAGPGVSRSTPVAKKGTFTWRVTLKAGAYRFYCAPHKAVMKGSFRVV